MRQTHVVELIRYVAALCPAQKIDGYTCDAWHDVLAPYGLDDARAAVTRLAGRQPFISVSEIIEEIGRHRGERLAGFQYEPVAGDDDPVIYLGEYRQQRAAVAAGQRPPELPRPAGRHDAATLTAGIGRTPLPELYRQTGPLARPCPICSAPLGRQCRTPSGANRRPHGQRRRAATGEQGQQERSAVQRLTAARTALAALTPAQRAALLAESTGTAPPEQQPEQAPAGELGETDTGDEG